MDMDIPLPEELELLEANTQLEEDEDYIDFHPPDPYHLEKEDEEVVFHEETPFTRPESAPSADDLQINCQKRRPRSFSLDPPGDGDDFSTSGEKRTKIDDEDWLRYSPPKETIQLVEEEEAEAIPVEEILSRFASEIKGECIPVTAPSGAQRVYAKICRDEGEERVKKLDVKAKSNGLIVEPFNVLLQKAEQDAFTKAMQASSEDQNDIILPETLIVHEQLWVDKYSPNSFTELLSDEQTNREVLLWLKQWDPSVFGSEIRSTSDDVLSALRRHSTTQHQRNSSSEFPRKKQGSRWNNVRSNYSKDLESENSNLKDTGDFWNKRSKVIGPPEQKILLLCGSPGLGKTTLAHVAARHCGYRVVEINASDERSSSAIETKILDVVQMNSVTADSRPKCLVIDEIDGALGEGKGAIDVIIKMVSADKKNTTGKENVANAQSGKTSLKERKAASLSRPVICICNDLYAPALRPLRQVAKVHIFVQPTVSRVVNRLKYICNKEEMKTSSFALTALAEYTECDIRSCLNTLQFLNKKKQTLNVMEIGAQVVGRKDMSRSVFDIWKELFQKRKLKRERSSNARTGGTNDRFDHLHSLISNRGDYDLIFDGIHENILQLHYHDPMMEKTVKCLDSFGASDVLQRYMFRTQQMALYAYYPGLVIPVHHMVAQVQKPNIEWPKSYQRCRRLLTEKQDSLRSWQHKIPPYIGRHLSIKSLVEDSISHLLHILSPPNLRPVAFHLISDKEKDDLVGLVSTMVSYSISYKNVKSVPAFAPLVPEAALEGYSLTFDPPISDLISFKDFISSHHVLSSTMKQVLIHEVEKQKILQASSGRTELLYETNKETNGLIKKEFGQSRSPKVQAEAARANISENMGQAKPNASRTVSSSNENSEGSLKSKSTGDVKKPSRSSTDFFARFRKPNKDGQHTDNVQKAATSERDLRPLIFKFNEGFTNAIKRPVRMRDFLL